MRITLENARLARVYSVTAVSYDFFRENFLPLRV